MKKTKKTGQCQMTRREFVGGALAAGAVVTGAPALLRGQNLNSKLDIAFIGAGGRGSANIRELTVTEGQGRRRGRSSTAPGVPHPETNVNELEACSIP